MPLDGLFQGPKINEKKDRRRFYEILRQELKNERSSFESHWRDLSDHILPRRSRFFVEDVNRGDRRTRKIIDSTATLAVRTLAAGMMGGVTSPARPWFRLAVPDQELAENSAVKRWLSEVTRRMTTVFLRSNLYNSLPILYKEMGTFATSAVFIEEDFDQVLRTFPQPIGSYYIANNDKLKIDAFMREFRMTVRQLVSKFAIRDDAGNIDWSTFSTHVRNQWENGQRETWIDVVHVVAPNPQHDPNRMESRFKRFASVYYERGSELLRTTPEIEDRFLSERGYDNFPVLVGRWETTGEDVYGTDCPGMTSLGDIKQLQHGEKRGMQAVDKMVNPPMKGPSSLRSLKASLLPGDITYIDERDGMGGFRPIHEVEPRIQELEAKQAQIRGRIRRAFFEDLFLMLATSDRREITATEVEERHEEKLLALGSVLEQLNQDVLDPLIDITFEFMLRQGLIPDPPPELAGSDLKVEYISIMAQAQKLAGLAGIERFSLFAAQIAQLNPSVLDKVDLDQLIDEYGEITGVPPTIILSDEEASQIRVARAQAQAQAQAAEELKGASDAAQKLSKSDLSGDNLLTRLLTAAQAGSPTPELEEAAP